MIAGLGLDPPLSALIRTRVAISNGHPADDLAASVLDEGASTFGDFDNHTLEGGNMRLAEALAAELGAAVHLSSPVRKVRWSQGAVNVATDRDEIEVDAVVVAIPTAPLAEIEFDPPLEGATAEALRAVTYGQNSKLFLRLRSPAPPSAIMSVAGHFWTYTQLGADGEPAPFVIGYTGTMSAIDALGGSDGVERWVAALVALRAGPRSGARERHAFQLERRPLGAGLLLGSHPLIATSRRRPGEADRPPLLRRRAHGRRVARADGGGASERAARGRTSPAVYPSPMRHTAHGYWLEEAGDRPPLPSAEGELNCDVLVVGGGYTGMWAAWQVSQLAPAASVILLESDCCGHGPSGRNGGFANAMWFSMRTLRERFGGPARRARSPAAQDAVDEIGRFCSEQRIDAWYRQSGYLQVSAAPAQDGVWDEAVADLPGARRGRRGGGAER